MFGNSHKTIGMFICGTTGTFEKKLCSVMTEHAVERGYNLAIFNGFRDFTYQTNKGYTIGESNIVNLPPYEELSGIIIMPDTFIAESFRELAISTIRKKAKCPIISIRTELEGFHNIMIDNRTALENMIGHFIEKHHVTKIAYLGGPKNHPDARLRLECFRNTMAEYGLFVREDWIVNGTFWIDEGARSAEYYFDRDKSEWPQAIICANDYMAVSMCDECLERGIDIPGDILISGFDNLPESEECYPPLSTVDVPVRNIAKECIDVIESDPDNSMPETHYVATDDIYRATCGCGKFDVKSTVASIKRIRNENESLFRTARSNTYMSMMLQNLDDYEELGNILYNGCNDFKELYICLCVRNTDGGRVISPRIKGYPGKMYCVYGICDGKAVQPAAFNIKDGLLPVRRTSDEPVQYYFTTLHYQDNTFGYVVHTYENGRCYDRAFQNWMTIVGNAIENIRTKHKYAELVDDLNSQYLHESMTGLYNRRGFDNFSQEMYERSVKEKKRMMLIELDMDNLKTVNDRYGHSEGDRAIDIIASALKKVEGKGVICSRVGGDEFWIMAYNYTEEMMEKYIEELLDALKELDGKEDKPYSVEVSYGAVLTEPESGITMEEYINAVDAKMYKNKREHKKRGS